MAARKRTGRPKRGYRKPKRFTLAEVRDAARDAYYQAGKDLGYPLTRKGINRSIYIDQGNWLVPGGVLINYEEGHIPSWEYYEFGWQLRDEAESRLQKKLGKAYYIEGLNAALDAVWTPHDPWDYRGIFS
jgi:hypothetical protein